LALQSPAIPPKIYLLLLVVRSITLKPFPLVCLFEGLTQLESLQPKDKEKSEHVLSCFTQYSPLGKAFKDSIRKHWYIIDIDPQLKPIFKYPPHTVGRTSI
jgi:hypothetical protein